MPAEPGPPSTVGRVTRRPLGLPLAVLVASALGCTSVAPPSPSASATPTGDHSVTTTPTADGGPEGRLPRGGPRDRPAVPAAANLPGAYRFVSAPDFLNQDVADLSVLCNARNEVLHGPEAIEAREFQTRSGVDRDAAVLLLARLSDELSTRTQDGWSVAGRSVMTMSAPLDTLWWRLKEASAPDSVSGVSKLSAPSSQTR